MRNNSIFLNCLKIFGLTLALVLVYTVILEWALNSTTRKFAGDLVRPKYQLPLKIAIATIYWPRPYRQLSLYDDVQRAVLSLLYIDGNVEEAANGIALSIKLATKELGRHGVENDKYYYTLQRIVGIINRSPVNFDNSIKEKNIHRQYFELSLNRASPQEFAYSFIEQMLYRARNGASALEVQSLYNRAISAIENTQGGNELNLNAVKFKFYYGYAKCIYGESDGGADMVNSLKALSENSATFHEAMIVNWDWPLVGNLASKNSPGYVACHSYVDQMRKYAKSVY